VRASVRVSFLCYRWVLGGVGMRSPKVVRRTAIAASRHLAWTRRSEPGTPISMSPTCACQSTSREPHEPKTLLLQPEAARAAEIQALCLRPAHPTASPRPRPPPRESASQRTSAMNLHQASSRRRGTRIMNPRGVPLGSQEASGGAPVPPGRQPEATRQARGPTRTS